MLEELDFFVCLFLIIFHSAPGSFLTETCTGSLPLPGTERVTAELSTELVGTEFPEGGGIRTSYLPLQGHHPNESALTWTAV